MQAVKDNQLVLFVSLTLQSHFSYAKALGNFHLVLLYRHYQPEATKMHYSSQQ